MMEILQDRPLILASKSPRRSQLLREANIPFQLMKLDVDETVSEDLHPFLAPEHLALRKAKAGYMSCGVEKAIVLGADSMVFLGEKIFGKPEDADDAFRMLAHLSGKTHTVITGVALVSHDKEVTFSSKTMVTIRPLDKEEIEYYIRYHQPFDKAGAYGIQDWLGHCKVSEIQGTYTNVMGLPVDLVYEGLRQFS